MTVLIQSSTIASVLLIGSSVLHADLAPAELQGQVEAVERAFAQTMADRDHDAFASFLSEEAVFLGTTTLRGSAQVAEAWKVFFEGPAAPFSWEPETVEVLESGTLAISTGPVYDAAGGRVSTFTSIWRLEEGGAWRVIFDRGSKYCP